MAKRFRNHNPNQYVLVFLFLFPIFPILPRSWIMSCIGSLRYRLKPKMQIAYVKILLTTKMIQHSKSMQKKTHRNAISNQKNRRWVFRRHCLARFRTLGYSLLASCGTLGRRSRNPWVPRNAGWKTLGYSNSHRAFPSVAVWPQL